MRLIKTIRRTKIVAANPSIERYTTPVTNVGCMADRQSLGLTSIESPAPTRRAQSGGKVGHLLQPAPITGSPTENEWIDR